jgi:hypothetical protein
MRIFSRHAAVLPTDRPIMEGQSMAFRNRKPLKRRALRLECLESRELLSADLGVARPAAEVSLVKKTHAPLSIYGSLEGQGVTSATSSRRGTDTFLAAGPEAPLGSGTFTAGARYKLVTEAHAIVGYQIASGHGTLTDEDGVKLNLDFSGTIYESGPAYAFTWTGTVVGGTGEYKKAAGSVDMYGTYSTVTDQFIVLGYTLTLTHA